MSATSHALAPDTVPRGAPAPDVTVLLATYNGGTFLRGQLHSLLDQVGVTWRLLWRDDGSADGSVAVMEAFETAAGDRLSRVHGPAARLGVTQSYYTLVSRAPPGASIAFCDQDDVWLPGKLARGQAALSAVPPGTPALYCARQQLVDADLRPIGVSVPFRRAPTFPMALTQNIATGCTVMLNAAAADLLRAAPPPPGTLHDWWSYLLISSAGGRLIMDDEPVVLYRQHGANAVGAPTTSWRRATAALRRGPHIFMQVFRIHCAALLTHRTLLTPAATEALENISAALNAGPLTRIRTSAATAYAAKPPWRPPSSSPGSCLADRPGHLSLDRPVHPKEPREDKGQPTWTAPIPRRKPIPLTGPA